MKILPRQLKNFHSSPLRLSSIFRRISSISSLKNSGNIIERPTNSSTPTLIWKQKPKNVLFTAKRSPISEDSLYEVAEYLCEKEDINLVVEEQSRLMTIFSSKGPEKMTKNLYSFNQLDSLEPIDFIVTAGGDGTILYLNNLFQDIPIPPILSFSKGGSLGFLLPHEIEDYKTILERILNEGSRMTNRMRLECLVNRLGTDDLQHYRVLNEVVLHRGETQRPISFDIKVNSSPLTTLRGDGVVIATPTGSTGYSLSSGGSMVQPLIDCILFTPICPRSLSFRPLLLPAENLEIEVVLLADYPVVVSFDGITYVRMKAGDKLMVKKCPFPLITFDKVNSVIDWIGDVNKRLKFNLTL